MNTKSKCWYVKAKEGYVRGKHAMTMVDAMLLADELVFNGYQEVEILRGQPQLEFK